MATLCRRIRRRLLLHPFRTLAIDDQRRWTGLAMLGGGQFVAREIARTTDNPRIGLLLPTSGLFPMSLLGAWTAGRTIVPLNYLLAREQLDYVIADAGLDTVVTVEPMLEFVGGLPDGVRALKLEEIAMKGLPPLGGITAIPEDREAILLYTSGTSGNPKGVMLTEANIASNIDQIQRHVPFTPADRLLGVLPQFHTFGLTVMTVLPLLCGASVVYSARFVPNRIVKLIREHRPTVLVAIPSMYNALRSVKSATPEDFASLRYVVSGGEPLPDAVYEACRDRLGIDICEGYGLTETSPVTHWCLPSEQRRGSVGRALPDVDVRIVGENGEVLPPHTDGEIRMRGPNVMRGYYGLSDETAAAFDDDGFFRTGDMGRVDEDGFLSITGRLKEMLIIGGENVFPREIEEVLNRHPDVKDSAVVGAHDPSRGEVAVGFVEMQEGASFDEASLRSHCREGLAQFKVPREIRCVDELPRNPTGKIMRRALKERLAQET